MTAMEKKQNTAATAWNEPVGNTKQLQSLVVHTEEVLANVSGGVLDAAKVARLSVLARIAASKVPQLLRCTQESFVLAFLDAAKTGLEWDGEMGALVPFKDEAKFLPMYKGLLHLAVQSGGVIDARAVPVYKGEPYSFFDGDNPRIVHDRSSFDVDRSDATLTGVYFVARLPGGGTRLGSMSRGEIDKRKAISKTASRDDSPWRVWYTEMAIKTVLKHELKQLPRTGSPASQHLSDAITIDSRAENDERSLSHGDDTVSRIIPPTTETRRGVAALKSALADDAPLPEPGAKPKPEKPTKQQTDELLDHLAASGAMSPGERIDAVRVALNDNTIAALSDLTAEQAARAIETFRKAGT